MFDLEDMIDLVCIFDAWLELNGVTAILMGTQTAVPELGEGILGNLSVIVDLIQRHVPGHDPALDLEDQEWWHILGDRNLSARERAEILITVE